MDKAKIIEVLSRVKPEIDFETAGNLVTDGLLDSFGIVSVINELNEEFDIDISIGELRPENLNSVDAIAQLVERLSD